MSLFSPWALISSLTISDTVITINSSFEALTSSAIHNKHVKLTNLYGQICQHYKVNSDTMGICNTTREYSIVIKTVI